MRIIGIDVPGFGVPTHAEAKDVLAGAMLRYARLEAEAGPVQRPRGPAAEGPAVTLIGELFPADPVGVGGPARAHGPGAWRRSCPRASGATSTPPSTASRRRPCIRSTRRPCASSTPPAGPVVGSGPVGVEGTAAWLEAIGKAAGVPDGKIDAAKAAALPAIRGALDANPIKARVTVSGYEGSELLVARLLIEAGAEVPYVGTACPRTEWSDPDREWLEAHGAHVQYRASLEQDMAAMRDVKPDLALGTTPAGAEGQGAGHPRHLLHQHGLGPAAVRAGRRRGPGRDRRRPDPRRERFAAHGRASSAGSAAATPPATAGPACRTTSRRPRSATGAPRQPRASAELADAVGV